MTAKYWFESLARIPVEVDIASEYRYRDTVPPENGVAVFISQSGETIDTLAALRHAKSMDQKILSIVNAPESAIARESDSVLQTLAGPEIGVASTKAFTTQLTVLACLAVATAEARGTITPKEVGDIVGALTEIPAHAAEVLNHDHAIRELAVSIAEARDVLYLGRGTSYPIALEGALKLKEISYIHAEGSPPQINCLRKQHRILWKFGPVAAVSLCFLIAQVLNVYANMPKLLLPCPQ
jgi:glucosamine--fructose-6-phosphate aminotransferase (isomerizing)